jgi:hypothetical protein
MEVSELGSESISISGTTKTKTVYTVPEMNIIMERRDKRKGKGPPEISSIIVLNSGNLRRAGRNVLKQGDDVKN